MAEMLYNIYANYTFEMWLIELVIAVGFVTYLVCNRVRKK